MGGHALSSPSIRLAAAPYHALAATVSECLAALPVFQRPGARFAVIPAYREKPSFGDMDVLTYAPDYDGFEVAQHLAGVTAPEVRHEKNSPVTSLGLLTDEGQFQVDLIYSPAETFDFALAYYSFNDLGNLMGSVARAAGFKFGHLGLDYVVRGQENESLALARVSVTTDFSAALRFLGYDDATYSRAARTGFPTLTSIFRFASSTPYFESAIFDMENLRTADRARDRKRPTYTAFLAWVREHSSGLPNYSWGMRDTPERQTRQADFLARARERFPAFAEAVDGVHSRERAQRAQKARFNGDVATRMTGLTGPALGRFLRRWHDSFEDHQRELAWIEHASDRNLQSRVEYVQALPDEGVALHMPAPRG